MTPNAAVSPPEIYSIKRHGTTIESCEREPVHTPGCVQSHGVLAVLRHGDLTVAQISENAAALLGVEPAGALNRPIADLAGTDLAATLARLAEGQLLDRQPTLAGIVPAEPGRRPVALSATVHSLHGDLLLEFEPAADDASVDYFPRVRQAVARMRTASSLQEFGDITAEEVWNLTGLDRVMIYRFHPDHSGEVFSERRRDDLPSWIGLRYPEHDIPRQAREIFKRTWIRPLVDARAPVAELVPLAHPDTGRPIEMTHCALRGPSVMYTEYLANMRVAATLTLSIMQGQRLWGLIACHHESPRAFSPNLRAACEFVAQVFSMHLTGVEEREHLRYLMSIDAVHHAAVARAAAGGRLGALAGGDPAMTAGISSEGFAVYHDGAWNTIGLTPSPAELHGMLPWLGGKLLAGEMYVTDAFHDAYGRAAGVSPGIGGMLAAAPRRAARTCLCWFRAEQSQTVNWAGNPHDMPTVLGPNGPRLTPRRSFELFVESVRGRCRPWLDVEIEAGRRMRGLVDNLFLLRAERMAADPTTDGPLLPRADPVDAFVAIAGDDLKEPLRGIRRYVERVRGRLDAEPGFAAEVEQLRGADRLGRRMNQLIDALVAHASLGKMPLSRRPEDLNQTLGEALNAIAELLDARQARVVGKGELPDAFPCDAIRVREVFKQLVANAAIFGERNAPAIRVGSCAAGESPHDSPVPSSRAAPPGSRLFFVEDDGIGIEPHFQERIFELFRRLHGREEFGGGVGAGLAVARQAIEQQGGEIWVDSVRGVGSRFCFTLPQRAALQTE